MTLIYGKREVEPKSRKLSECGDMGYIGNHKVKNIFEMTLLV